MTLPSRAQRQLILEDQMLLLEIQRMRRRLDELEDQIQRQASVQQYIRGGLSRAQAEADYVNVTGDTMTGALNLDTINEATANAGVTIDGLRLRQHTFDELLSRKVLLKFHPTSSFVYLRNEADTADASFSAGACNFISITGLQSATVVQPRNITAGYVLLRTQWGGNSNCAQLTTTGSGTGEFSIQRGGDVTMLPDKCLAFTESTYVTIDAVGGITIQGNNTVVETNGGAGADNLDTINGGTDGQIVVLHAYDDSHTVTCRDGVGNLSLAGGVNFDLDSDCDTLTLMFDGDAGLWLELCRADNA